MIIGKPAVVIERIPAGTESEFVIWNLPLTSYVHWGGTLGVFSVPSFAR